ncbi:hypothetical protein OROMI_010375 [Orobanche minor]
MEFWGAVVESGEHLSVVPADCRIIHISQVAVGESKKDESVCLFIKVNGKKFVIGTLFTHKKPQLLCDVVVDREFELSHNWKNGKILVGRYFWATKMSTAAGKQTMKIVEPEKDENSEDGDDDNGVDDLVSEDDEVETVEPVEEDKAEESNDDYSVYDADSEFDKADPPMKEEGKNEDGEETTEEPLLDRIALFSKDDLCCGIPNPNTQQPSQVVEKFWKNEDFIKGLRRQISHYPFMATDLMCYAAEFIEESPEERIARINRNYSLKYFLNAVHPRFRMRSGSPQYFVWVLDYARCAYRAVMNNTNERI